MKHRIIIILFLKALTFTRCVKWIPITLSLLSSLYFHLLFMIKIIEGCSRSVIIISRFIHNFFFNISSRGHRKRQKGLHLPPTEWLTVYYCIMKCSIHSLTANDMQLFGEFIITGVSLTCYRRPYRCLWIGSIFMTLFGTMTMRDYRNVRILDRLLFFLYTDVGKAYKKKCSCQKGLFVYSSAFSQKDFFQLTENYKKISVKWHVMKVISTCPKGEN